MRGIKIYQISWLTFKVSQLIWYLLGVKNQFCLDHTQKTEFWYLLGVLFKTSNDHARHSYMGVPHPWHWSTNNALFVKSKHWCQYMADTYISALMSSTIENHTLFISGITPCRKQSRLYQSLTVCTSIVFCHLFDVFIFQLAQLSQGKVNK